MWAEKHFRKDDVSYIAVLLTEAHNNGNIWLHRSWWRPFFTIGSLNIMLQAESVFDRWSIISGDYANSELQSRNLLDDGDTR